MELGPANRWLIAVGSTRRPKLDAVHAAASQIAPLFGSAVELEVLGYDVESGVRSTPLSRTELMQGARQRAESLQGKLRAQATAARYFVGLEGGLEVVEENGRTGVFLESWAFVSDGVRGRFGCSGSIEVPQALAEEVLSGGVELAEAIDRFAGIAGIRDGKGAWGVLSHNLISRSDSFQRAVLAAFAPFYNAPLYRRFAVAAR
jgi:inosine/xanthosine triphosphatase